MTAQHRKMLDQVLSLFGITPDRDLNVMQPGQDLFGLRVEWMDGTDGEPYSSLDIPAGTADANGLFGIGGASPDAALPGTIQNGPDGVRLADGKNNAEMLGKQLTGAMMSDGETRGVLLKGWNEIQDTGQPTSIPQANWNAVRSGSLNMLRVGSSDPVLKEYFDSQPERWANTLEFVLGARDSFGADDKAKVIDFGFSNFRTRYEQLKSANPSKAEDLAYSSRSVAESVVPILMRDAASARGTIQLTSQNRFRAMPGSSNEAKAAAARMNNVLDVLVSTQDSKGDPTIEVLNTYFNAGIQQEQPK